MLNCWEIEVVDRVRSLIRCRSQTAALSRAPKMVPRDTEGQSRRPRPVGGHVSSGTLLVEVTPRQPLRPT